jgi:hypothetical protein
LTSKIYKVTNHQVLSDPTELFKVRGRKIRNNDHKLSKSIWNNGELLEEWKESIIVPMCKKDDKRDCSNFRGISILPHTYKTISHILLSRLTPYAEGITGDHQYVFRRNKSVQIIFSAFVKYLRTVAVQLGSLSAVCRLQESL